MLRWKIPPQITRLLLVTAVILLSYYAARLFLIPDSFGKYGWYRANVLQEYQTLPVKFAGASNCADCHADVVEMKSQGGHKLISCESCHGPAAGHMEDPSLLPKKAEDRNFCIRCHEMNPSRPAFLPQVVAAEHSQGMSCMDCHIPHLPMESP
jgi:predicted CXXCH cytochrome family protein